MKTNKNAYLAPITTAVVLASADVMTPIGLAPSPTGAPGAAPARYHSDHTNIAL